MPKAVYRKYVNSTRTEDYYYYTVVENSSVWNGQSDPYVYPQLIIDEKTGTLSFSGVEKNLSLLKEGFALWNGKHSHYRYKGRVSASDLPYKFYVDSISIKTGTREVNQRGIYLSDMVLDYGSVPENGRHTDGYWYEFVKLASDSKVMIGGIWKDAPESYVEVNGILRPVEEIKTNNNGIWKG